MISNRFLLLLPLLVLGSSSLRADERPLRVVTTIPDLAWVAAEIGGSRVEAKALLSGSENPHYIDAVPEFIRQVADADIVCIVGLDLEVGYMPPVLARSGNALVQPGGKGYCETGKGVSVLDKPTGPVDRSMGDVHPAGNPHFFLSPKALAEGAKEIASALERADPARGAIYRKGLADFTVSMETLSREVSAKLKPLRDQQGKSGIAIVIEYHKEFAYFFEEYGIKSFGSVEEKPGVPPSAGRLGEVAAASKAAGVRVVLAADYNPARTLERFAELSGVTPVVVPTMMQSSGTYKTYAALQNHIAEAIAAAAAQGKGQK